MKVLIINSSYRKKGNTYQILELLRRYILNTTTAKDQNIEVEYLSLADRNLSICRGCRLCFDK